jgi:hypothetical protein
MCEREEASTLQRCLPHSCTAELFIFRIFRIMMLETKPLEMFPVLSRRVRAARRAAALNSFLQYFRGLSVVNYLMDNNKLNFVVILVW